jgi:ElaB/YqjD/DUF883 family membrane-anchored ribosome-binding protein
MPAQSATAELVGLRAELEKPAAASRPAAAPEAAAPADDVPPAGQTEAQLHIEQVLQDLQSALSEAAENAEDIITEHPLPSVSAAFLLGVAVGWLAARS